MQNKKLATKETIEIILQEIPQQAPFRFIDKIDELSSEHVIGHYTYKKDEYFYKGHFPSNPVTPGVILIETMAQIGLVALGLYCQKLVSPKEKLVTFFTDCEVEFFGQVNPLDKVIITGEKIYFRKRKIKAKVKLEVEKKLMVEGVLSGFGVVVDE